MNYADAYSRAVRYAAADAWTHFRDRLQSEPTLRWGTHPKAAEERPVAADAYQDATGDEEGAALLRDHSRHVVVDGDGRVRKGRFTDEHVNAAHAAVEDHLRAWSGGDWAPVGEIDWEHAHGHSPADYDAPEEDFDADDFHRPREYGTAHVGHYDHEGYEGVGHHFLPMHEVGGHLADVIEGDVDGADYGWNTDGVTHTHVTDTDVDTHRLGQLHLGHGDRLSQLYDGRELDPWRLDEAIGEANRHRDQAAREAEREEDQNGNYDSDAHERHAAASHVADALRKRKAELDEYQDEADADFRRLLHNLRTAPVEEVDPR